MDQISGLLSYVSYVGLRPWDLAFIAAWALGAALCAVSGLEKAYKALFGLALGCVLYVAATWFVASLASLPMSPESRGFFSANQNVFLHAAWLGIWFVPVLAAFSPSLAAAPHARTAGGLVLRVLLVPALFVGALSAVFALSAEKAFPFAFDNLVTWIPGVSATMREGSVLYGWSLQYGVLAVVAAIFAGTYAIFLSPWVARLAERMDSARLPSFFRDAQPALRDLPPAAPYDDGRGAVGPHGH